MKNLDINRALDIVSNKVQTWLETLISMMPNIIVAFLVLIISILVARAVRIVTRKVLSRVSEKKSINSLFSTLIHFFIIGVGLIISLNVLHLEQTVTSLLAGAGIIGLAIGFAFQDISANFISGIMLAFRKPIKVGDIINSQGHTGIVEKIDMRVTMIRTFQGLHVIIPNKDVFQTPVTNFTKTHERRIDLEVGISYAEDLEEVKAIALKTLGKLDFILPGQEPEVFYNEFGESSINCTIMVWVFYSGEQAFLACRSKVIIAIKKAFNDKDITIPFPIRTLDFGIKGGQKLSETKLRLQNNGQSEAAVNNLS